MYAGFEEGRYSSSPPLSNRGGDRLERTHVGGQVKLSVPTTWGSQEPSTSTDPGGVRGRGGLLSVHSPKVLELGNTGHAVKS